MKKNYSTTTEIAKSKRLFFLFGKATPLLGVFSLFSVTLMAQAPTISYGGPQTYTAGKAIAALSPASTGVAAPGYSSTTVSLGSGFNQPAGSTTDAAGNVYVANYGTSLIEKIPVGGGAIVSVGSGFFNPNDVKIDAAGNLYVADQDNNAIKEIPVGGGSIITLGSGFSQPAAVAVDRTGNIFVADPGNNAVKRMPAGGGTPVVLAYFNNPFGVAVDGADNVYVTDATGSLFEIPAAGGAPVTLLAGLNNPNLMAADASGNIFITDSNNGLVKMLPAGGGALVTTPYSSGFPFAVSSDISGNLYISDPQLANIFKISPVGGYYINPALPVGLNFNSTTGVISGTPLVSSPATTYTILAYNATGSKSATVSITVTLPALPAVSYVGPKTYTAYSAITALTPTSTNVAAPAYSINPTITGSGFGGPEGTAEDAAGNIYVADPNNNVVKKIPAGGGTPVVIGSGFNLPTDVALDAAGNLYVADYLNNEIKEIKVGTTTPIVLGSGFSHPFGVATDAAGNVYVGDQGNDDVKMIPAGNGKPIILASGLSYPDGLTVDAAGNVYFADLGNNAIKKIPAGGGTPVLVGTGFTQPVSVAVDASGNLFVADRNNNAIKEIIASSGMTVTIGSGIIFPNGVSVDTKGNVLVGDYGNNAVKIIQPVGGYYISKPLPTGLSFSNTTGIISGTATTASPVTNYTITAYNSAGSASATESITITPLTGTSLSGLTISGGTLSPVFASGTVTYTTSVANAGASITVTPTATVSTSSIKVDNTAVTSGTASGAIPLAFGATTISVVVTPEGGTSSQTYTVQVIRPPLNIATLSNLTISSGTLTPAFATGTTSYTDNVANTVSSIAFRATTTDPTATETINGTAVPEGTVSPYIPLNVGVNTITVVVTAQDGSTTDTYTLKVTRAASSSNIATLSNLTISSGTLTPAFATGTTSYTDVAHAVSSIAFRATTTDPLATETINGTAVPEGTVSPSIPLNVGVNNISIVVTAQDGVTKDTYTIAVTRLPNIATLSKLTISSGTLSPAFAGGTTSYTDVAHSVSSIAFRATTTDPLATETINGTVVPEGTVSPFIPLSVGVNNISIVATAQDGVTTDTYTIAVTRLPEIATLSKLTISSGTLSPAFATGTTSYTDVAHSVSSIAFRATTTDALATETINGTAVPEGTVSPYIPLSVGVNNISIVVTAQDGVTTDTYTIAVTRLPEVATLSKLTISSGTLTPAFASGTTSYTDVAHAVSSIAFRATTTDALATETINGTAVPEGTVSPYIPLSVGVNNISIVVTAQDGVTTDTYKIAVTRLPEIATLSGLTISSGTLSPAFATATTGYTDNVANTVSSIAFRATTTDPLATETINGTAVPEGTVSPYVPLSVGMNKIPIIVTAQDGVTTEAYTITVTRAAPPVADAVYQPISVETSTETPQLASDGIVVHQGVSPNGDGIDDFLRIDNITNYPDNQLAIMNRNGMLVYEAKGYDNASRVFDGRSNKNGALQLPGTYFYSLDYTVNGIIKHKTGFLVLKY
jgi:gliding motility-associated-like protein